MKYKCLIFDHDDTTVNSTTNVHYPCFLEFIDKYKFDINYTLEEYVKFNFDPGLLSFYKNICGFSDAEMEEEYKFWNEYASSHRSKAFDGIKEIMEEHKKNGGIISVVSHSRKENILLDYEYNNLPKPDIIFGFEQPREELKPSAIPVLKTMEKFSLNKEDILVIDDLKPGYLMAKNAGVSFAAASWCFNIPENVEFMKNNADYFLKSINDLKELVLSNV